MEKNKAGPSKTPCICLEDSVESVNDDSETAQLPNFKEAAESLKKHLEQNEKCFCMYNGRVKVPNRVSWIDEEKKPPECVCEEINTVFYDTSSTSTEESRKKKKTFVQTLKYLVTCACCKKSEEPKPKPEPELEYEEVDSEDSGIISLLGRTYSEASRDKDDSKKEPIILVFDVPDDLPAKVRKSRQALQNIAAKAELPEDKPVKAKTREVPQEKPAKAKTKEVPVDLPVKAKTKEVPQEKPVKAKTKEVPQEKPAKAKPKDIPEEKPVKAKTKEVPQEKPVKAQTKDIPKEKPVKAQTKEVPQEKPAKVKTKDIPQKVTPKVSFAKPLPKMKQSLACICSGYATPKYASKSSSRVSTRSSQVKCKCTDPEETPSGQLISTKCICGQLTQSEASFASGYTIGSKRSKPDCCYPEKSEELIRKIEYQRPSQYSYSRYDQPLQTYGREAPSIRSVYTPSTISYADSMPEEDDISQNDAGSTYSYPQSTSAIPSSSISATAAGPSQPTTLYQRLVKRFWLESRLYREPYAPPSRVQSAPSYISDVSLHRPAWNPQVTKPTKSKEKVCHCSKIQLVTVPSKETKAETTDQCICLKKSDSKKSNEVPEECHCLEILYMSKSPSKSEEKILSKTDDKVLSKAPSIVSAGTSKDQGTSENVPTIIVTPAEETEALLADEKGSKSSSNSTVVTVIDMHALQVPSVLSRPVVVQKSTEIQEQVACDSSAENPPLSNDGSGWWDKSKHLIIGSTVVGATAIGAYQYFKD